MQCTIETKALKHAAVMAKACAYTDSPFRSYEFGGLVQLHAVPDGVRLVGSDSERDLFMDLPATVNAPGTLTIHADKLHKAVTAVARSKVPAITIVNGGATVEIGTWGMPCEDNDSKEVIKPAPAVTDPPFTTTIGEQGLFDVLMSVMPAVSTEETRYYLNGVHLHGHEGQLRAVTTNGCSLAMYDTRLKVAWPDRWERLSIILPRLSVALILRALKARKRQGPVTVEIADARARFTMGDTVIATKLIDGTFPDYQCCVPLGNPIHVEAFAMGQLAAELKAANVKRGTLALIAGQRPQLRPEAGNTINLNLAPWPGPDAGFDAGRMRRAADAFGNAGVGTVDVALADGPDKLGCNSPILITATGGGLSWVEMPIRL